MAAVMNLAGAFLGQRGRQDRQRGAHRRRPTASKGMGILFAALVGAIVWNLITWYFGLPSSSSHALFGGMVGAALAGGTTVHWTGVLDKVVIPMFLSPVVGLVVGYLVMVAILWIFRQVQPAQGQARLPHRADRLGGRHGARPRSPGRAEDDGRRGDGAGHRRRRRTGDDDPGLGQDRLRG